MSPSHLSNAFVYKNALSLQQICEIQKEGTYAWDLPAINEASPSQDH